LAKQKGQLANTKRWVVKVGSAILTNNGVKLDVEFISSIAGQIAELRAQGVEVVLVSSGAVAAGVGHLGLSKRPQHLNELQAAAAVGQVALVQQYDKVFCEHQIITAQVLLTHADIADRERYLNARNTLQSLLQMEVLTIVNENDTVATDEICFGDNDNLAALVANLVEADLLVLLTDQDGLYDADPRLNSDAKLIREAKAGDSRLVAMASEGSALGRGGMVTKLSAASKASRSGASTVIANGREPDILASIYEGNPVGTLLNAGHRVASRKQWMAGQMKIRGQITLDPGAVQVLKTKGKSLLPVGVVAVDGEFDRGALVSCIDVHGAEVARGLVNYNSDETQRIKGLSTSKFTVVLGYNGDHELIHRDNLVVVS
jgi:glutamate 5-kinase